MALGYSGGLAQRLKRLRQPGLGAAPMGLAQLNRALPTPAQPAPLAPAGPIGYGSGTSSLPTPSPRRPPPLDPRQIARRSANQAFRRQQDLYGRYVQPGLAQLQQQANTDRFSDQERAGYLAPHLDALNQQFQSAEGSLARQLAERGLGDSSAMTSGLGALAGAGATARTGVISNLFNREEDRQLGAQDTLRNYSAGLFGSQQGQAGNLDLALRQLELQKEAMDQANSGGGLGDIFGGLLGGVGGLAGLAGSLGWRPWRQK